MKALAAIVVVLAATAAEAGISVRHGPSPAAVGRYAYQAGRQAPRYYYAPRYVPQYRGPVYVRPHIRGGVYVPGHYRTAPDAYRSNNWSTWPNVNPYTGRPGYRW